MTMSDSYALKIWSNLRFTIEQIQQKSNTSLSFEESYRNAYNLVLHRHGDMLYKGLRDLISGHLSSSVRDRLLGHIRSESDTKTILSNISTEWHDHLVAMGMIRDVLMYMDRVYVGQVTGVLGVRELGLVLFKEKILDVSIIKQSLKNGMIELIDEIRSSNADEHGPIVSLMGELCQMLIEMDTVFVNVYSDEFEKEFLESAQQYYLDEGNKSISTMKCCQYISHVDEIRTRELKRSSKMFPCSTTNALDQIMQQQLIASKVHAILDIDGEGGFFTLVAQENICILKRIYHVLSLVTGAIETLASALGRCLKLEGDAVFQEIVKLWSFPVATRIGTITKLNNIYSRFEKLRREAFSGDLNFNRTICVAFEEIVNSDPKLIELLALYFDYHLYKNKERISSGYLSEGMFIFKYIHEKDSFERFYREHLTRRLLMDADIRAEETMMSDIQKECGSQFARKISKMITDIQTSGSLVPAFKSDSEDLNRAQLSIKLIRSGIWPNLTDEPRCNISQCFSKEFDKFVDLYSEKHTGRRITLVKTYSQVEVLYSPDTGDGVQYQVRGSIYQISLLLLFENTSKLSMDTVCEKIGMDKQNIEILVQSMKRLVFISDSDSKSVILDTNFKSKTRKVKLSVIRKWFKPKSLDVRDEDEEGKLHDHILERERRNETEATIMRIMKASLQIDLKILFSTVQDHMKHRFVPSMNFVMKCVDALIERDYLKRSDRDRKILIYVA